MNRVIMDIMNPALNRWVVISLWGMSFEQFVMFAPVKWFYNEVWQLVLALSAVTVSKYTHVLGGHFILLLFAGVLYPNNKVISGYAQTCYSEHSWWLYSAAPVRDQTAGAMTRLPTHLVCWYWTTSCLSYLVCSSLDMSSTTMLWWQRLHCHCHSLSATGSGMLVSWRALPRQAFDIIRIGQGLFGLVSG